MENPDGQPTTNEGERSDDRTAEPVRNMADVSRLVEQRETWKAKALRLEQAANDRQAAAQSKANEATAAELEELRQWKANQETAAAKAAEEAQRSDGRKKIADAILAGAHPDHAETLRLMLPGLHEAGTIDLYSPNPDEAGAKAREALSKSYPQYFGGPDGQQAGHPGQAGVDLTGVRVPTDIDPATMAKLSKEQFAALFVTSPETDYGV